MASPGRSSGVAHGISLPGLLVFLGLGLTLGEAGVGVRFDNARLAQALGLSALVLILAGTGRCHRGLDPSRAAGEVREQSALRRAWLDRRRRLAPRPAARRCRPWR